MNKTIELDRPVTRGGPTIAQLRGEDPDASELWRIDPVIEADYLDAVAEIERDYRLMSSYEQTAREGGSMLLFARDVARRAVGWQPSVAPVTSDWPSGLMDGSHTSLGWLIHIDAVERARQTAHSRELAAEIASRGAVEDTCGACGVIENGIGYSGGLCKPCRVTLTVVERRDADRVADERVGRLGKTRADVVRSWCASKSTG